MSKIDELQKYIWDDSYWNRVLSNPPFSISIKRDLGFVLFKYNQIESDMSYDYVQASRGVILDEEQEYKIVCRPFEKFFNYGETLAAEIDWDSAVIEEKLDGSIIKLWFSDRLNQWIFSTNGTIFASNAYIMTPTNEFKTFEDLAIYAFLQKYSPSDLTRCFDPEYTYIFELVSPHNRIVVPYEETRLVYLTSVHNKTGREEVFDLKFSRPKEYDFNSLDDTLEFVKSDTFNNFKNEGFVVKDKYSNRIKVKTEEYLRVHRLRGEMIPNKKRMLELIMTGEQEEFLSYFPEYKEKFDEITQKLQDYKNSLMEQERDMFFALRRIVEEKEGNVTRKDFAEWAKTQSDPNFIFQAFDGKLIDLWVKEQRIENILKRISNEA